MANKKRKTSPGSSQPLAGMRPGGPNNPTRGSTPGPHAVDPRTGAATAGELSGGGMGGDIDRPDITGRGTTDDLIRHGDSGEGTRNPPLTKPDTPAKKRTT